MALFLSQFRSKSVGEREAPFTTTHASLSVSFLFPQLWALLGQRSSFLGRMLTPKADPVPLDVCLKQRHHANQGCSAEWSD